MSAENERPWPEREDLYPGEWPDAIPFAMDSEVEPPPTAGEILARAFGRFAAVIVLLSLVVLVVLATWAGILHLWDSIASRM